MLPSRRAEAEAAFARSIDAFEREVRCTICLETLSDPHLLSHCKHTFCKACCMAALEDSDCCPLCRAPASRRSCHPDEFMARLASAVVRTCRELRHGATLELDAPAPAEWRGRANFGISIEAGPYLARSAKPLELGEILAMHEQISKTADQIAQTNSRLGTLLAAPPPRAPPPQPRPPQEPAPPAPPPAQEPQPPQAPPPPQAPAQEVPPAPVPSRASQPSARERRPRQQASVASDAALARRLQEEEDRAGRRPAAGRAPAGRRGEADTAHSPTARVPVEAEVEDEEEAKSVAAAADELLVGSGGRTRSRRRAEEERSETASPQETDTHGPTTRGEKRRASEEAKDAGEQGDVPGGGGGAAKPNGKPKTRRKKMGW